MKKFTLGVFLLIGLCATVNAQQVIQVKANKEIVASLSCNKVDGYFIELQPLGYFSYDVLVDVDGQQQVISVYEYVSACQIPASKGSKVTVKVIGSKSNPLTFVVK